LELVLDQSQIVAIDKDDFHIAQLLAAEGETAGELGHAEHRVYLWLGARVAEDFEYIRSDGIPDDDWEGGILFDVLAPLFPMPCDFLVEVILSEVVVVRRTPRGCRATWSCSGGCGAV
jgi:hypothetical protein